MDSFDERFKGMTNFERGKELLRLEYLAEQLDPTLGSPHDDSPTFGQRMRDREAAEMNDAFDTGSNPIEVNPEVLEQLRLWRI